MDYKPAPEFCENAAFRGCLSREKDMKPIQIVAFDLDGTVLDSNKHLSDRNREALSACARMGIHIVPTTGRSAAGIIPEIKSIPGVRYAITTNGGTITDLKTGQVLERQTISNEKALRLMKIISRYHAMYDPYINGRGISQSQFYDHMEEFGLNEIMQNMVRATRDVVPDIMEYVERTGEEVEKINIYLADLRDREPLCRELEREPDLVITSSLYNNLEVNASSATKGRALMWLADYLNVSREATMALGDGGNDLSMIQAAGTGVAMANGLEEVKAAADFVTLSNDEDGVAAAIEKLVWNSKGK